MGVKIRFGRQVLVSGCLVLGLAGLQLLANSLLLAGALARRRNLVPGRLTTRVVFLSTFWGTIDSFRKSMSIDDMSVFLV